MLCRLCLYEMSDLCSLELYDNQGESKIIKIIAKFLHLKLELNDVISTMICNECWQHLDDFQKFYIFVEERQNEYEQIKNKSFTETAAPAESETNECAAPPPLISTAVITAIENNEESLLDIKDVLMTGVETVLQDAQEEFSCANLDDDDANEDDIPLKKLLNIKLLRKRSKIKPLQKPTLGRKKKIKVSPKIVKNKRTIAKNIAAMKQQLQTVKTETNNAQVEDNHMQANASIEDKVDKAETAAETNINTIDRNKLNKAEEIRKSDAFISSHMQLKCELCEAPQQTFSLLKAHFRVEHNCMGYVKCCGRQIKTRTFLVDHINYHLNPQQFQCEICNKYFKSKYNVDAHIWKAHPTSEQFQYECTTCGRTFVRKSDYERHIPKHMNERNFICEICQKSFTNKQGLDAHIKTIHKHPNTYVCSYCAQVYKNKTNFDRHVAEHEGIIEPQAQCGTCGEWLKNKNTLQKHMEVHEPIEVTCEICGRVCHTKRALTAHIQYMHRMEAIFSCSLCGKAFRRKDQLQEHMVVHTGEKTGCPHCYKEYKSKSKLYKHIRTNHVQEWLQSKMDKRKILEKAATTNTI